MDPQPDAKRQRRSFSPTSPLLDHQTQHTGFVHTPPPSVHMSPQSQVQLPTTTVGSSHEPMSTMPTPSPSGEGGHVDHGEHVLSVPERGPKRKRELDDEAEADAKHRRTDHERQPADMMPPPPPPPSNYAPPTSSRSLPGPRQTDDMMSLYSLSTLQASVARRDEVTGAKINKLRKSYEGKVKTLALEGRAKAVPGDNALIGFVHNDWDFVIPNGNTLWQEEKLSVYGVLEEGVEESTLGLLGEALQGVRVGGLPGKEGEKWKQVLALDEKTLAATAPATPAVATHPALVRTSAQQALRASAPASPRNGLGANSALRPDRTGKKRRYDESSYTGYSEGYVDDDGYSTGGVDDARRSSGGPKRQKRKVSGKPSSFYLE